MTTLDQLAERAVRHCRGRLRTMDKLLEALVRIPSSSDDADGNRRCLEVLAGGLDALGFKASMLVTESGREHLLARREGHPGAPPVLLLGHTDTIFDGDHSFRGYWTEGDYGRGPGVADAKGGLVVLLTALDALTSTGLLDAFELRVLLNTDHQQQSATSRNAIQRLAQGVDLALVFESATSEGALVRSRPGTGRFLFTVDGRGGDMAEGARTGRSAILEMAYKIPKIDALRRDDRGIQVNCGVVSGGSRANLVADEASLLVGVRCEAPDDAAWLRQEMRAVAEDALVEGCETVVTGGIARPPWPRSDETDALVDSWRRAAGAVGLDGLSAAHGAGGSDANLVHEMGTPVLDGLGPRAGALHTPDEWVDMRSLPERAAMTAMGLAVWRARRLRDKERAEAEGGEDAPKAEAPKPSRPKLRAVPEEPAPSDRELRGARTGTGEAYPLEVDDDER